MWLIFQFCYIYYHLGETDWKLRLAVPVTQKLSKDSDLFNIDAGIHIEKPQNDIHSFIGIFSMVSKRRIKSIWYYLLLLLLEISFYIFVLLYL